MSNLWLRIKIWTKGIVVGLIGLYALLFIYKNSQYSATFWYWIGSVKETSILVLVAMTFLAGVVSTLLVRTTFTTMRQVRELRQRNRLDRIERDQADLRAKAAMLKVKTSAPAVVDSPPPAPPPA